VLVLAICEGPSSGERIGALVVLAVILLVIAGIAALVLRFSPGERPYLVGVYVIAVVVGALVILVPGKEDDEDFAAWFGIAVAAGAACGVVGMLLRRRRWLTYVLTGAAGGATFVAGAVGLLVGWLAVTGTCLD
jgi:hypothetical protein